MAVTSVLDKLKPVIDKSLLSKFSINDLTDNLYQRFLDISTISVKVDTHNHSNDGHAFNRVIKLKNIKDGSKVRKLLRDAIEKDVMERQITYFDKV